MKMKINLCAYFFIYTLQLFTVHCAKNASIIIIGAGPSGIATATKLLQNGFENLLILEAEERIGGRIHSVKFGESFVDLGAAWCHGQKGNVVYKLVKDLNILRTFNLSKKLFYSDGHLLDQFFTDELYNFAGGYISEQVQPNDSDKLSFGDIFLEGYNSTFFEKYKNDKAKLDIAKAAIGYFEKYSINWESALDWYELSYKSNYQHCHGSFTQNWNGLGYKTILDVMMQKYPDSSKSLPIDNKIILSKEVTNIVWDNNTSKVIVKCDDSTQYTVDHVVFTPSLGVLKAHHAQIFQPELSTDKQEAIDKMGYGAVMKVYLQFPNNWWGDGNYSYGLVWSDDDKIMLPNLFPHGIIKDGISWIYYFTFFHVSDNNPNVLVLRFTGKMVPDIEKLPYEVIMDGCMFALNRFLGKTFNITQPLAMIHSSWYGNPHFRGAYSFTTVNEWKTGINMHEVLAEPIYNSQGTPVVQFAGEATNPIHFSTVHGAIDSGYREADRIIKLYN